MDRDEALQKLPDLVFAAAERPEEKELAQAVVAVVLGMAQDLREIAKSLNTLAINSNHGR
jgi:hypothetical protein